MTHRSRRLLAALGTLLIHANAYPSWLQCFVDLDESEIIMNYPVLLPEVAPHWVSLEVRREGDKEWTTEGFTYEEDEELTIEVRLRVPEALRTVDVQYVVETTEGAKFQKPVMCQGSRSYARSYDEAVRLEIDGSEEKVEVWGGWATGHEAVSLTPKLVLRMAGTSTEKEDDDEEEL